MPGQLPYEQVFFSMSLAFMAGLVVGSFLRVPLRWALGVAGVLVLGYWLWAPKEVEAWLQSWALWLEREVEGFVATTMRWASWVLGDPQGAAVYLSEKLMSLGTKLAFWAGVLGRVLS